MGRLMCGGGAKPDDFLRICTTNSNLDHTSCFVLEPRGGVRL